jgi:pimeloyl-ACP methyl ester carboxylesterase
VPKLASSFKIRRYKGSRGITLFADVGGDPASPPVLLLHGGGQTRHSWSGAMHNLVGRGYFVVNLDARGHGDSEWASDGDYTLSTLAQDIACVMSTLSARPALVGASMGGAASLLLVGRNSEPTAAALALVDIVPLMEASGASRIRAFMTDHLGGFATLQDAARAIAAYSPERSRPMNELSLHKNLRQRADGRFYWHWDPRLIQGHDGIGTLTLDQLPKAAETVRIPTLLVRGLESDVVSDAGVADLKRRIPQLEVFNVAEAGHMVAGDKNDLFNQAVSRFLEARFPVAHGPE